MAIHGLVMYVVDDESGRVGGEGKGRERRETGEKERRIISQKKLITPKCSTRPIDTVPPRTPFESVAESVDWFVEIGDDDAMNRFPDVWWCEWHGERKWDHIQVCVLKWP